MHNHRPHFIFWLAAVICLALLLSLSLPAWDAGAQSGTEVIVHYVEGIYAPQKNAFQVQVYLSVLDADGKPVMGLDAGNFSVTEDSYKVDIESVETALAPMNLVMVLDTSGTMVPHIDKARKSAQSFVASLGTGDQVAVLSFNESIMRESDFTSDFTLARSRIQRINAMQGAGTCLYDATYEAVQLAATLPVGRRAVIVLTDGKDETLTKKVCSTHTLDDVIDLASKGGTRTPVYTLGLGNNIDRQVLERLSSLTGGNFMESPDISQMSVMFSDLSIALKSEYVLTFTSSSAPGPHTVAVEVVSQGASSIDTRDFVLPALPPSVKILSPSEGQKVEGKLVAEAQVQGQGKDIANVVFLLNEQEAGRLEKPPYVLELANVKPGAYILVVVAQGSDGSELARSSVEFQISAPAVEPKTTEPAAALPSPTALVVPTAEPPSSPNMLVIAGGAGLGLVVIAGTVAFLLAGARRRRVSDQPIKMAPVPNIRPTIPEPPIEVLATLTVLGSDDPSMVDQVLNITRTVTQLGRGAQNDIMFPKDTPVSRHHAQIEYKNHQLWLSEVCTPDETGAMRHPRYGTFINDKKVEEEQVQLKNRDVIRLGSRVRLQVILPHAAPEDADRTVDSLSERTIDNSV